MKVRFEGTKGEIIAWLREKGSKVFLEKEVHEVHITRKPEGFRKEIKLAGLDAEKRKGVLEDEITEYTCDLVAQEGNKVIKDYAVAENLVGSYLPGVGVVHVYTRDAHEIPSFKVVQKYKRGVIGPVEVEIKVEE